MENSEKLHLPYIMPSQAQKHVTHNEAIRKLDAIVQLSAKSWGLATPPNTPLAGDRYIIADNASGTWFNKSGQIAAWQDEAWHFYEPREGWLAWLEDTKSIIVFAEGEWMAIDQSNNTSNMLERLGINTASDNINRFSVSSDASLFTHDGADHRLNINKSSESQTASVLFQNDFSGKAEFGLLGDDHFGLKQSIDGSQWRTSAIFDKNSASVNFPNNAFNEHLMFNLLHDGGRFAGSPENPGTTAGNFIKPTYFTSYNGSTFTEGGKFTHNNSTFGGAGIALDADTTSLISKLKTTTLSRRLGPEFYLMQVNAGTGTVAPLTTNAVTRHLLFVNITAPLWCHSTWGINVKAKSGSLAIAPDPTNLQYIDGELQSETLVLQPEDGWKQIVVVGQLNPMTSNDYNATLFRIYGSQGAQLLMALPFLIPANITPKPESYFGRIASIQSWR